MSPVMTRPRPQAERSRLQRDVVVFVMGGLLAIALILGLLAAVAGPTVVDRVSIQNATPYTVEVEVTGAARDGWIALGPVSPGARRDVTDVIDAGDRWIAHVSSAGTDGGEVVVRRGALEHNGWVITIPDEVTNRLAGNGATPPAPRG